jgi:hypothetical protein
MHNSSCPVQYCKAKLSIHSFKPRIEELMQDLLLKFNPRKFASRRRELIDEGLWATRFGTTMRLEVGSFVEETYVQEEKKGRKIWKKQFMWKAFVMVDRNNELSERYIASVSYGVFKLNKNKRETKKRLKPPYLVE